MCLLSGYNSVPAKNTFDFMSPIFSGKKLKRLESQVIIERYVRELGRICGGNIDNLLILST